MESEAAIAEERSWPVAMARHKARDLLATTIVYFLSFFFFFFNYIAWTDKMRKSTEEEKG